MGALRLGGAITMLTPSPYHFCHQLCTCRRLYNTIWQANIGRSFHAGIANNDLRISPPDELIIEDLLSGSVITIWDLLLQMDYQEDLRSHPTFNRCGF